MGLRQQSRIISENDIEKKAEEGDREVQAASGADPTDRLTLCQCHSSDGYGFGSLCGSVLLVPWAVPAISSVHKACSCAHCSCSGSMCDHSSCSPLESLHSAGWVPILPEKYAYRYLGIWYSTACSFLYPLTLLTTRLARLVAAAFGIDRNQEEKAVSEEKIISIVDEAHEQGVIQEIRSGDDPEYHLLSMRQKLMIS